MLARRQRESERSISANRSSTVFSIEVTPVDSHGGYSSAAQSQARRRAGDDIHRLILPIAEFQNILRFRPNGSSSQIFHFNRVSH
jgi:hypothetical protein